LNIKEIESNEFTLLIKQIISRMVSQGLH